MFNVLVLFFSTQVYLRYLIDKWQHLIDSEGLDTNLIKKSQPVLFASDVREH